MLKGTTIAVLFKMYGNFAELVDLAYWWSCIGKSLRLQPAQQACFTKDQSLNQLINQLRMKMFVEKPRLHRVC